MRKGMMVGKGKKGYHNVIGKDPIVHSMSAKGIKQPQRTPHYLTDSYKEQLILSLNKKLKIDESIGELPNSIIKREVWMLKIPQWKLDQNAKELMFKSEHTGLFVSAHYERKPKKINEKFGKLFIKSWDVLVWDLKTKKDVIRKRYETKDEAINYSKNYMKFHSTDEEDSNFGFQIHESDEFPMG